MKKVWSLLISVGMYFSYALDFSPETLDLVFHSLKMDENQITESFCDSIESLWVKKMGKLCESSTNSIAYNAPADESVYLEMERSDSLLTIRLYREYQICIDPFLSPSEVSGNSGKLQFSEVLKIELLRMQSFGIIKMQQDSLENFLQEKIELMKAVGKCEDIDGVSFFEENGAEWTIGPGCCSLVDSSTAISRISKVSQGVSAEKVSAGKFRLSGVPLGMDVSVFDLNGKLLLRKNFDGGFLEIPNVPAVARVHGNWFWMK